ncbi:hypothetical protein THOB06_180082 [Vibrio rotiferianus]|nr:hypothetical protein THOG10_180082 [Vibrio rotiferianus]CAH1570191.1 hypothetical protein THOB06_180082 [Vibrio rotiferianus]
MLRFTLDVLKIKRTRITRFADLVKAQLDCQSLTKNLELKSLFLSEE